MSVVLVATLIPTEGEMDQVVGILEGLVPKAHAEDGCEMYALHRGEGRLVFVEKWRDMAALGAHANGPVIKELNEKVGHLVAGPPDVQVLEAVPAGEPAKGAV